MSEKQPTVFRVDTPRHKNKVINTKNRKTINASNDVSDTLYVVDIIGSKKTGKTAWVWNNGVGGVTNTVPTLSHESVTLTFY